MCSYAGESRKLGDLMCSHCWRKPQVGAVVDIDGDEKSPKLNDLVAMDVELQPESQRATQEGPSSSSSLAGWPFGLSSTTCIRIHAPSPTKEQLQLQERPSPAALAFQQQFANLQSTFLLPFFSDVGESSSSDSEVHSEAASSFFKDSRRITLGSLIGLPMDNSFHHFDGAQFHDALVTTTATTTPRRSTLLQLPSCGILELLRCGRTFSYPNSSQQNFEFGLSDHEEGESTAAAITTTSTLAAFLQQNSGGDDAACFDIVSTSSSSHSPDWNDQFVSCHSVLSSAEAHHVASPKVSSSTPSRKLSKMQRSSSMKSFFSSICCRIDTVHRP